MIKKSFFPIFDKDGHPQPAVQAPAIDGHNYFTGALAEDISGSLTLASKEQSEWERVWALIGGATPAPELPENARFVFVADPAFAAEEQGVLSSLKNVTVEGARTTLAWEKAVFAAPPGEPRQASYALVILPLSSWTYFQWNDVNLDEQRELQRKALEEAERARRARFQARAAHLPKLL